MKPTSVISLVVAVILVIVGLVTCMIAQNMAQTNGEYLFSEVRGEDSIQTVDLDGTEISKIELIVENAVINIIGRQEKSYIEFVNFRDNYYSLSQTNRVLSFDEIPNLVSMLKFWENGFSFKGMRYILSFGNDEENTSKEKVINIYLSTDKEIKIFDIKADYCTLNLENMTTGTDYNIETKEITVNSDTLKTTSSFNINAGDNKDAADIVNLNLNTSLITNMEVKAKEFYIDAEMFRCSGNGKIICEDGNIDIATIKKTSTLNFDIKNENGSIFIEGAEVQSPYTYTGDSSLEGTFAIETKNASVNISSSTSGPGTTTENN